MDKATETLSWLNPRYVMADKGYDSRANHEATAGHDAVLVCPARRKANSALYEGIYTEKGVPTCIGMVEMDYVRSDPQKGHLYRCRREACHLETRKGVRYCADEVWENRRDNPRLFGPLRQKSPKWKALYRLRQAGRARLQGHEGKPTTGTPLCQGTAECQPSRGHVGAGLCRYCAGPDPRGRRRPALDGAARGVGFWYDRVAINGNAPC